jgi:hypothetical protein
MDQGWLAVSLGWYLQLPRRDSKTGPPAGRTVPDYTHAQPIADAAKGSRLKPQFDPVGIDRLARDGMKFTQACDFQFEKDPPLGTFDSRESMEDFLPGAFQLPSRLF